MTALLTRVDLVAGVAPGAGAQTSVNVVNGIQFGRFRRALLSLDITAAAAAGTDTLDVFVQKNVGNDALPVWTDFIHFTQVLGNGGTGVKAIAEVTTDGQQPTLPMHAIQDAALAAGTNAGPWSDRWRVKAVQAGATANFTFTIHGHLQD